MAAKSQVNDSHLAIPAGRVIAAGALQNAQAGRYWCLSLTNGCAYEHELSG